MAITSLHHLTATVDQAAPDLQFYVELLGLRLVKKTVNFDNHFVYHFYYGDALGRPSTIMTTFPYHGWGVPVGIKGAGQITVTSFSAPERSLDFWRSRLSKHGLDVAEGPTRFGSQSLVVTDPSGLAIELIGTADDDRPGWTTTDLGADVAIRGLASVTLSVRDPEKTVRLLTETLGFSIGRSAGDRTLLAVNGDRPGHRLEVLASPDAPQAKNGLGTVHHVALAIPTEAEQASLRDRLLDLGYQVTKVLDRQYFRSIYFREPGGVLLEVATEGPGFAVDESPAGLGQALKLPPWEEPNRAEIEAKLPST